MTSPGSRPDLSLTLQTDLSTFRMLSITEMSCFFSTARCKMVFESLSCRHHKEPIPRSVYGRRTFSRSRGTRPASFRYGNINGTQCTCMYVCMYAVSYSMGSFLYMISVSIHQRIGIQIFFHWTPTKYGNEQDFSLCMYVCMYMRFVRLINPERYFALLFYFCMHVRTCEPQIFGFF